MKYFAAILVLAVVVSQRPISNNNSIFFVKELKDIPVFGYKKYYHSKILQSQFY